MQNYSKSHNHKITTTVVGYFVLNNELLRKSPTYLTMQIKNELNVKSIANICTKSSSTKILLLSYGPDRDCFKRVGMPDIKHN